MKLHVDPLKHFWKTGVADQLKTRLSALTQFVAIMTDGIVSLCSIVQSSLSTERSLLPSDSANEEIEEQLLIKSNKGDTIPRSRPRRIRHLLPTAASNLLTSCLETFCKKWTDMFSSNSIETSVMSLEWFHGMMNYITRECTFCFKMFDHRHY